jgi:hypothetical protein
MTAHDAATAQTPPREEWRGARAPRWTPLELVAMVLGFIVFWPIGLAILGWKFWQRRTGYPGDLRVFADEGIDKMRGAFGRACGGRRGIARRAHDGEAAQDGGGWVERRWGAFAAQGFGAQGFGATGNHAFDEWKASELARLDEERRKLQQAEREFADYQSHLRQARDRDEFDRFVRERDAAKARGEAGWRPFASDGEPRPQAE